MIIICIIYCIKDFLEHSMKKVFNLVIGGIQQKVLNLVLITIILMGAAVSLISFFQLRSLRKLTEETSVRQQEAISGISRETMDTVVKESLGATTQREAEIADNLFSSVAGHVRMLGDYAEKLFDDPDAYPQYELNGPDAALDGQTSAQLVTEEGVDLEDEKIRAEAGLIGNLTDMMLSLFDQTGLDSCFIGTPSGLFLIVDDRSGAKISEDGSAISIPVTQRPWYTGAVEKGGLYFSDIETDHFTGDIGIVCSLPVYHDGELAAVVGTDVFLNGIEERIVSKNEYGGFSFVLNQEGHVIFSPEDQGVFMVRSPSEALDLRTVENSELSDFISEALTNATDVRLVDAGEETWYMAGATMETEGWAIVSVEKKSSADQSTDMMLEQNEAIQKEAVETFRKTLGRVQRIGILVLLLICIVTLGASLAVSSRIVKPLEIITKRIASLGGKNLQFKMEDAYRTGDEIEVLAESFASISKKTVNYMDQVRRVSAEKERISSELSMAREIQISQLPNIFPAFPERPEFEIFANMSPAKEVGGDFYDFFLIDDDHLAMVMADVSGKGVPAALFMMIAKILIKNRILSGESPGQALRQANRQLMEGNRSDMFVTVWLAVLEISTGKGIAVNAGHEHPAVSRAGGDYELVVYKHSPAVAIMDDLQFREHTFELHPGDGLFVYTDGVPEATAKSDEMFGTARMLDALNSEKNCSSRQVITNVMESINNFVDGAQQFDDITMMSLIYRREKGKKETMRELVTDAKIENLDMVLSFVGGEAERAGFSMKGMMQIDIAVEEIFVNIAKYAYAPNVGTAVIQVDTGKGSQDKQALFVTFMDHGVPYNPLAKDDPDTTLNAFEREIGGLGIFMVKKNVDDMRYEYKDGMNILTLQKNL